MVRDILDLHRVGGQGVRMSDETTGHWTRFHCVNRVRRATSPYQDLRGLVEGQMEAARSPVSAATACKKLIVTPRYRQWLHCRPRCRYQQLGPTASEAAWPHYGHYGSLVLRWPVRFGGKQMPLRRLAAMAPGSKLKVVKDGTVEREFRLQVPPRVYNFKDAGAAPNLLLGNQSTSIDARHVRLP